MKITESHKWKNTGQFRWAFEYGAFYILKMKNMDQISPMVMASYTLCPMGGKKNIYIYCKVFANNVKGTV